MSSSEDNGRINPVLTHSHCSEEECLLWLAGAQCDRFRLEQLAERAVELAPMDHPKDRDAIAKDLKNCAAIADPEAVCRDRETLKTLDRIAARRRIFFELFQPSDDANGDVGGEGLEILGGSRVELTDVLCHAAFPSSP